MMTTSQPEWDQKFRLLRHQGMNVSDAVRHSAQKVIFESYPILGYNYRMTDIQAAVGREQLKRLPEILAKRRELARRYRKKLEKISGVQAPAEPSWARSNWQSYCVRLPEGIDQAEVMQRMLERGVATRRGIMCSHREEAYPNTSWRSGGELKESEAAQDRCVLLPLYPAMTEGEQDQVLAALSEALQAVKT